ncbi:hypothetical protein RRG08_036420 [Elysia crispata]|uniref:Uncharacterized protein n=1 Tax=Elysia crispata TaxID=231223 RepID=A0AAE1DHE9_9GAST|nr:hypothetical protein RRG08_036420 [Elysia crispata]
MFGRTVRGPMAVLRELWTQETDDPDVKTTYQYVIDLQERLEETINAAKENLKHSTARYRQHFNKKTKPRSFKAGDEVLLLIPSAFPTIFVISLEMMTPWEELQHLSVEILDKFREKAGTTTDEERKSQEEHQKIKTQAREHKERDKMPSVSRVRTVFDLQKIMTCPKLNVAMTSAERMRRYREKQKKMNPNFSSEESARIERIRKKRLADNPEAERL